MTDTSQADLTNSLTQIKNDYYTAGEVAEIRGVTRQTVNTDIHAGKYPGAFQLPYGKRPWVIPKAAINQAVASQDVVTLSRQITPQELQQLFAAAVRTAVQAEIEPLQKEIAALKQELQTVITETRAERKTREQKGFWSRIFS